MADLKISQLTGATTPLAGTEVLPIVQSSATKKVAVSDLTAGRAVSAATVATTGNAAVGTSLVAWNANYTALDVGGVVGITSYLYTDLWYNSYINAGGTTVYKNGGYSASRLRQDNGTLKFSSTGSTTGTGGGTATLTDFFTVDVNGNYIPNQAGKGINFTANTPAAGMTSQLLNWYEEGTYTPTLTGGSSNPTVTYNTQAAQYTRIGRVVYVNIFVSINTISGGSGDARVTLPFNVTDFGSSLNYPLLNGIAGGTAYTTVALQGSSTADISKDVSTLSNGNEIRVTGFYFV